MSGPIRSVRAVSRASSPAPSRAPARKAAAPLPLNGPSRGGYTMIAALSALIVAVDFAAAFVVTVLVEELYHFIVYGVPFLQLDSELKGLVVATGFVLVHAATRSYGPADVRVARATPLLLVWAAGLVLTISFAFLFRAIEPFSRASTLILLLVGPVLVLGARRLTVETLSRMRRFAPFFHRRVLLVGTADRIARVEKTLTATRPYVVVASVALREEAGTGDAPTLASREEDMVFACTIARYMQPDLVVLALPLGDPQTVNWCARRLMSVPATITLSADEVSRAPGLPRRPGAPAADLVELCREPFSIFASAQKRLFDLVVASLALVALAPVLLACAIAIRLEGPGPILFRQTRYGINLAGFRIFKFRTMRTMEDGRGVKQATRDDPRITRVGRVLRRWNLDELPQLLNVVEGTMSLVGPRPHAMAHDQAFGTTLAEYARRHNAKPGITGWAQVNGYRGEIVDEADLRGRLTHDLHYLDNWSLWFDMRIIALTIVSPKAYRNAR